MATLDKCECCPSTSFIVTERATWRGELQETFHDARHSQPEMFLRLDIAAVIDIRCARCGSNYPRHKFTRFHWEER
jgi:hypothetical protein